jgi:predicted transglutaminase-like cysteine proteinase
MSRAINTFVSVAFAVAAVLSPATVSAMMPQPPDRRDPLPLGASPIPEYGRLPAPVGYHRFCIRYPEQCESASEALVVVLTPDVWRLIGAVNTSVNRRIRNDPTKGAFDWDLEVTRGNCNDYAVQKRAELLRAGFPQSALSLAMVMTATGEGHLVLTVRTDRGDFVLDNLRGGVLPWTRAAYRWIARQSVEAAFAWVALAAPNDGDDASENWEVAEDPTESDVIG